MNDALVVQLQLVGWAQGLQQVRAFSQALGQVQAPMARVNRQAGQVGQARQARQQVDPMMRAFRNLIFSTRIGFGANGLQVMPLVGRLIQTLGGSGGFGMAVAGAAAAISVMAAAASHAAAALNGFRQLQLTSGGTPRGIETAKVIGGYLGAGADQIGGAAEAFAQQLSTPEGMTYTGTKMGNFNPFGAGPMGAKDQMKQFMDGLDALRKATDDEALEMIRATPALKEFARVRDYTDAQYAAMKKEAEMRASFYGNPQLQKDAREFAYNVGVLRNALSAATAGIGAFFMHLFNALMDWLTGGRSGKMAKDEQMKALNDNTAAVQEQTKAMQGLYGGGERARGAIPHAFMYQPQGVQNTLHQSINLGAFAL